VTDFEMTKIKDTKSICPECNKIIPAEIFEKDGKVHIRKECPEHGKVEDLYWGSYEMYKKAHKFAHDGKGISNPTTSGTNCPFDCGLCPRHKSHTALANIALTNRCDLACWYCFFFADKAGYVYEPTKEQIGTMLRNLREERPVPTTAIQLTGGEPTLRKDLIDIIKMCKDEGFKHIQLNTNGIKLAVDPTLAKKVRDAGVNTLYLSFDGVTKKTNPKNHFEIPKALENCRKANLSAVFVPTIINTVNDHEIGGILNYALDNVDVIRGIDYQPVSLVGRVPTKEREKLRITIPDVIQRIEEQTNGQIVADDFYPVPTVSSITHVMEALKKEPQYELTAHPCCGMATYIFKEGDKIIPITRFVDIEGLMEFVEEVADDLHEGKPKLVVLSKSILKLRQFIDKEKQPKDFDLVKVLLKIAKSHGDYNAIGDFHRNSMFIGMMHFQDKFNYDIERVERCCIHYATPSKEMPIVPFCSFNVLPELYRDKIQKEHSVSIAEWEKKTGRKLSDDFYKRKVK
jgi:uncharacterized radical SAM superfamily Fe-S cluster-containing enzyme